MKRIVAKKKWETVKFNKDDYDDRFADLIEFQELTDYVVEDVSDFTKSKAKKRKASQIDSNDESKKPKLDDGKEKLNLEKMSKKKKKQKIKQPEKVGSVDTKPAKDDSNSHNESSDDDGHDESAEDPKVNLDGMSDWVPLFVPPEVLRALKEKNFTSPTPIQSLALPSAIRDRLDIIGAAETGSGKALAFAIPIVARLLQMEHEHEQQVEAMDVDEDVKDDDTNEEDNDSDNVEDEEGNDDDDDDNNDDVEDKEDEDVGVEESKQVESVKRKSLKALILTPTRELALQIKEHIEAITKYTNIKCVVLVGGLAAVKQMRKLSEQPEIVIATPGRLWQLIQDREPHVFRMEGLKFLVIDEVDRMMEQNHFVELEQILNHIHQKCHQKKQVFVFSATLTFVHSKPKRLDLKKKKKRMKDLTVEEKLNSLKTKLRMSNKPKIFDLTKGRNMMAQQLVEKKVNCQADEKDIFLYYFLKTHPGRTIIFANSKEIIKKINSLMAVLHFSPIRLCADMDQKMRLKNVERFKELENGLLIATDVAARGLDIPDVQYVVHYHVPMTAENYVHRSGRTARSNKDGLSVILVSPQEENVFQRIMTNLKKGKDLPLLDVDRSKYQPMVQVVKLAQTIEKEKHRDRKQRNQKNWLSRLAEEADMIFDDDDDDKSDGEHTKEMEHSIWKRKIEGLQMELNQLLGIESKSKRKKKKKNQKP